MSDQLLNVAQRMQQSLKTKSRFHRLKKHRDTFHGSEAVTWLIENQYARDPIQAQALGESLLCSGLVVGLGERHFKNGSALYKFNLHASLLSSALSSSRLAEEKVRESDVRSDGLLNSLADLRMDVAQQHIEIANCKAHIRRLWLLLLSVISGYIFGAQLFVMMLCVVIGWWVLKDRPTELSLRQHVHSLAEDHLHELSSYLSSQPEQRSPRKGLRSSTSSNDIALPAKAAKLKRSASIFLNDAPGSDGMPTHHENSLATFLDKHRVDFDLGGFIHGACCVVDMTAPTQPIVFVNDAFLRLTGYAHDEVMGKNCRFLQGKNTSEEELQTIRNLIKSNHEGFVTVTNYTKSGREFQNILYLRPLRDKGRTKYYLGCQSDALNLSAGQTPDTSRDFAERTNTSVSDVSGGGSDTNHLPSPNVYEMNSSLRLVLHSAAEPKSYQANSKPIHFENDFFEGEALLRTRIANHVHPYFQDKQRKFEIQLQGRFKRVPSGVVWFGGELKQPMKLSRLRQAVCNVLLKFVNAFGRGVHASFGEEDPQGERPHMMFPVFSAMDRVVITPRGETPPRIGDTIERTPEMDAIRKQPSDGTTIKVGPTYTMCFYSKYVDFELWSCVGLPGLGKTDLHGFWGDQGLQLVLYCVPPNRTHAVRDRDLMAHFELVHKSHPHYEDFTGSKPSPASQTISRTSSLSTISVDSKTAAAEPSPEPSPSAAGSLDATPC